MRIIIKATDLVVLCRKGHDREAFNAAVDIDFNGYVGIYSTREIADLNVLPTYKIEATDEEVRELEQKGIKLVEVNGYKCITQVDYIRNKRLIQRLAYLSFENDPSDDD